MIYELTHKP